MHVAFHQQLSCNHYDGEASGKVRGEGRGGGSMALSITLTLTIEIYRGRPSPLEQCSRLFSKFCKWRGKRGRDGRLFVSIFFYA